MKKKIDLTKPIEYEIGGVKYTQGELTLEKSELMAELITGTLEIEKWDKINVKEVIQELIKKKLIGKMFNILIDIPIEKTKTVTMSQISEVIGDFLQLNLNWITSFTSFLTEMMRKKKNEKPIQGEFAESLKKNPPKGLKNISEKSS